MPIITLDKHYSSWKPPLGAEIDWAHPLARGLRSCYVLNENAGVPRDLVTRYSGSFQNTVTWSTSAFGPTIYHGYSPVSGYKDDSGNVFSAYPITSAWYGVGQSGAGDTFPASESNTTTDTPVIGFRGYDDAIYFVRNDANTGGNVVTLTGKSIRDKKPHLLVGVSAAANSHQLYYDDVASSVVTTNITTPITLNAFTLGYLRRTSDYGPWTGNHILSCRWTRALSASEILQLYVEPFCFLKPRRTFVVIGGGEAPATSIPVIMNSYRRLRSV